MKSSIKPFDDVRIQRGAFMLVAVIVAAAAMLQTALNWPNAPGLTAARVAGLIAAALFLLLAGVALRAQDMRGPAVALIAVLFITVLFSAHRNGGVTAPTVPFILIAPLAAALFIGARAALAVCAASVAGLFVLWRAQVSGAAPLSPHTEEELALLKLSGVILTAVAATAMVYGREQIMRRAFVALKKETIERQRSARALEAKTRDFDLLFEHVPVRLWIKDDKNRILRLNEAAAASMGVSVAEATGADTYDLFPDMAAKYHADDLAVIESGVPRHGIVEEYTPSEGERGWVRTDKTPIVDPETRQRYVIVASTDITDMKEAETALAESELRFATAVNGASVGIWDWIDVNSDQEYWTPRQFQLLGYQPNAFEPSFTKFKELLHPDDHEMVAAAVEAHFERREPFSVYYRLRHKTLGYRWFLGTGQAIWDDEGRPKRMIGSIMDVHEQKTAEHALAAKAAALAKSNKELDEFARVASHDLKGPLRGIANIASWLEEDIGEALTDETRAHLDLMKGRIVRLEKLLDDLLSYARLDTGVAVKIVDVAAMARDHFDLFAPEGFRLELDEDLPVFDTPRILFERVLRNLIENAIKHHDRDDGVIRVSAQRKDDLFEFSVSDDGPGVDARFRDRIFEMFQTLKTRQDRAGSGMGLAMTRKIVEGVGGEVRMVPNAGGARGTAFVFTWPVSPEKAQAASAAASMVA